MQQYEDLTIPHGHQFVPDAAAIPWATRRALPTRCAVTNRFAEYARKIRKSEVREDDVWVLSFPKSGTTWVQEMVWCIGNDFDIEAAKSQMLDDRFPFIELIQFMQEPDEPDSVQAVADAQSPRFLKSHLRKDLLPKDLWTKTPKIVYVARNVKDVVVSNYYHHKLWHGYIGSLDEFVDAFIADAILYAPYWDHVLEYWSLRHQPNVLFITYEEMKRDLAAVIKRTAKFLDKSPSATDVSRLQQHLSFESMKTNRTLNMEDMIAKEQERRRLQDDGNLRFIRKGETGAWKKELSPEAESKINHWSEEKLAGTDYVSQISTVE